MNNDRIVLHSDPAKNYKASDSDMNGGRQLVIGYLLIKLCKELGVPFDCFIQVVTRLYDMDGWFPVQTRLRNPRFPISLQLVCLQNEYVLPLL